MLQMVAFDADGAEKASDRWWAPEISAAIMGHPGGDRIVTAMVDALAASDRTGIDLNASSLVRCVVAYACRLSTQPGWARLANGRVSVVRDGAVHGWLDYAAGRIVAAAIGQQRGIEAVPEVLAQDAGHLWWLRGEQTPEFSLALDEALRGSRLASNSAL
jgi:hypothetical protein